MARPQKKGLDYFPLDTDMDVVNDDVMMLEAKYGTIGFTTLIKLYMKIYQDNGYFMEWNEKTSLLLSKRINVSNNSINDNINLVNDIINDLVRWNVFDEKLYEEYKILTSNRIQKTYMEAVKKRKDVEMDKRYLTKGQIVNSNINLINSDINTTKKRIEENSKEENSKESISSEHDSLHYNELKEYFNSFDNLPKIRNLSQSRKDKIKSRIDEVGLEDFKKAIKLASESSFCTGNNDRGWKADIDWFIKNDTNIVKVLEGKYNIQKPKDEIEEYLFGGN